MFERLTLWDDANKCWVEDHSRDTREWKNGHTACMNRLAAYEDSGLTPAQVEAMKMDMEQLRADNINAEMNLAHMAADKDEQAGTIMRLDNGLKKLRSSLQWLKETIHDLDYKAWAEDNIGKIDALIGGKEDV